MAKKSQLEVVEEVEIEKVQVEEVESSKWARLQKAGDVYRLLNDRGQLLEEGKREVLLKKFNEITRLNKFYNR